MKTVILKSKEVSGRFLVGESVSLDSSGANPIGLIKEVEQFINLATITIELYDEYRNIDLSQYQELGGLVSHAVIYNFLIQEI